MKALLVIIVLAALVYGGMQWKQQEDRRKAAQAAAAAHAAEVRLAEERAKTATPKPLVSTSSLIPPARSKAARDSKVPSGLKSGGL